MEDLILKIRELSDLKDLRHATSIITQYLREQGYVNGDEIPETIRYELIASQLFSTGSGVSNWGTYYGPFMTYTSGHEVPSKIEITLGFLNYIQARALNEDNPFLQQRYADIIIDLKELSADFRVEPKVFDVFIDKVTEICRNPVEGKRDYGYAWLIIHCLEVAFKTKKYEKAHELVQIAFNWLFNDFSGSAGYWKLFSDVFLYAKKHTALTELKKDKVITFFEDNFLKEYGINEYETLFNLLVKYYKDQSNKERLARIMVAHYRKHVVNEAGLKKQHFLRKAYELASNYGLQDEVKVVEKELSETEGEVINDLHEVKVEQTITNEQMEEVLNSYIHDSYETSISLWTYRFIPDYQNEQSRFEKSRHEHPLQFLATITIIDPEGRQISQLPDIYDDPVPHFKRFYSSNSSILSGMFMEQSWGYINTSFNAGRTELIDFILECPFVLLSNGLIIEKGINAFFEKDYISSIHILVPQIEKIIRLVGESQGVSIYIEDKINKGFKLKGTGGLLRDNKIKKFLDSNIKEGTTFYLKQLLIDELGIDWSPFVIPGGVRGWDHITALRGSLVFDEYQRAANSAGVA